MYRRGKVTKDNSIFHANGSVSCPFSTNSHTDDEYFTIDSDLFYLVEGRSFRVMNDSAHKGTTHYVIATDFPKKGTRLHWLLYHEQTIAIGLTTDHLLHWTDNRRASVEFIEMRENLKRGAAIYHAGRKTRGAA